MQSPQSESNKVWDEQSSQLFIEYGRYFVPEREQQIATICALIPPCTASCMIIDLCCGPGLLAGALLEHVPTSSVLGLDGSPEMLQQAQTNLAHYGERFQTMQIDLADRTWHELKQPIHAVVSSLAIHHLDTQGKQVLFADIYQILAPNGVLVIADVIAPAGKLGTAYAAEAWDNAVRQRAMALDGNTAAFNAFAQQRWNMYRYFDPDDIDQPSGVFEQLKWLEQAGFVEVDVYWMLAGHAIFGGRKPSSS